MSSTAIPINTIETERLILREITPEIYKIVFDTYTDDRIMQFFGFYTTEELVKEKRRYEGGLTGHNRSFKLFQLVNRSNSEIIGGCGFHNWFELHKRAELGYDIRNESNRGKGLMKEALAPIIHFGFHSMQLNRIEALIGRENTASQRLVKGFQFTQEGILREHWNQDGALIDSLVFGLLKKEYEANKAV